MYKFIDVFETSEGMPLPSEALKLNGEYIENQIEGYRTLTVTGREALSAEVEGYETGIRDGSTLKGKRYPARTIKITYQLIAKTNEEFREAYNKLASILNVTDAELIFNDEQDKFFTGTPSYIGEVEPGQNAVVGEFEILCLDPFKYSVIEYEAEPVEGESSVLLDYKGTYKSYPTLRAEFYNENEASEDGETVTDLTGSGDCGYVAFFNEDEKIIQLGDPDEVDGENSYQKSQTLFNHKFNAQNSWGTAAKSLWAVNKGITSSSAVEQAGTPGMAIASYAEASTPEEKFSLLLAAVSKANSPYIRYRLFAKSYERTANTVKVTLTITASLDNSSSYFGRGYNLRASVYIGGAWKTVELKNEDDYWKGTSSHSKNITVTLTGLTASQVSIPGIKFKAFRNDSTGGTAGTLAETSCENILISTYPTPEPETHYLAPANFGTGSNWHGPSITRIIPADASGVVGATNFTLTYSQKMSIGKESNATSQLGAFQVLLVSGSGSNRKIVAGVNVYKGASGKTANLRFYVNGTTKETISISLAHNNTYFNASKSSYITKTGKSVTFNIAGIIKKTYQDANITNTAVNEVTFTLTKFGTKLQLEYNGLYWAKFVKNNCDTWKDIPNKFSAGDAIEAVCKTGEIYLNGDSSPAYGALGNDWEDFYLKPGLNQIGFSYSDWVQEGYAPSVKVKYREVFL